MRHSAQRQAILDFLRAERRHYSATQIYDAVREKIPNISLGTVYRNLSQLIECGEILAVEAVDTCVYYDGFTGDHAHFVCRGCHRIYDFPLAVDRCPAVAEAGFDIETERVLYYGLCADCRTKEFKAKK